VQEPLNSRLLFPWTERRFTYAAYSQFLERLRDLTVVPMREFARGVGVFCLRHDVDSRLDSALELAALEAGRGIRATYFVLHTAPYWNEPGLIPRLKRLQELGHEVGLHNDLVTVERLQGVNVADYAHSVLERLRGNGIDVVGAAAHGSPWCHRLGFHNNYVFAGWDEPVPGFPDTGVRHKLDPAELGLEYEAYHVPRDAYFSDSAFIDRRRAHPSSVRLPPAGRTIALIHPCHWDASMAGKAVRLARRLAARLRRGR